MNRSSVPYEESVAREVGLRPRHSGNRLRDQELFSDSARYCLSVCLGAGVQRAIRHLETFENAWTTRCGARTLMAGPALASRYSSFKMRESSAGTFAVDTLTPAERSARMSLVRSKDTKPELRVRRLIYSMGFRYRLHSAALPGKPDLVFGNRSKVIFVHGCFWHRHGKCKNTRWPKSRLDFWKPKLERNHARDQEHRRALRKLGWSVLVIWECQIGNTTWLSQRIREFLQDAH